MNKIAQEILEILEKNGFCAYIVGGYVRDYLLGIKSNDIDICTDASMKEILDLIPGVVNGYSLNIKKNEFNIDITPFREEFSYANRKPVSMSYTSSLIKDLQRRDFTINAICMNKDGKIIDHLNGISDLKEKTIRMIGEVPKKLEEDPLRILRAIRFATVLDFSLEEHLAEEIELKKELLHTLSTYRKKEELSKILLSPNYKKGLDLIQRFQLCKVLGISFTHVVYTKDLCGMWAQISLKEDYPFTKLEKKNIVNIKEILDLKVINAEVIYKYGLYLSLIAGEILGIDENSIYEIHKKMPIYVRKDLEIQYQDILKILNVSDFSKGKEIENDLIKEVVNGRIVNSYDSLKSYLLLHRSRWFN